MLKRTKVQIAANGLDVIYPNWEDHISIENLDFLSDRNCILGQLFGSFARSGSQFKLRYQGAFVSLNPERLKRYWLEEINQRKEAKTPLYIPLDWEARAEIKV